MNYFALQMPFFIIILANFWNNFTSAFNGVNRSRDSRHKEYYERWLDDILKYPKARLFSEENYAGNWEDYEFASISTGGCYNFKNLQNGVKSLQTFGKCVRVFSGENCTNFSLAVYPGTETSQDILNHLPYQPQALKSIGPCLPEEFAFSDFKDPAKENFHKNARNEKTYIPDLVEFFSGSKLSQNYTGKLNSNYSLKYFTYGPQKGMKNRVEFLKAEINVKHLNLPLLVDKETYRNYYVVEKYCQRLEKQPEDILGFGIPPRLGGPGDVEFNYFAQTQEGKERWSNITSGIGPFLDQCARMGKGESSWVHIGLNFQYEHFYRTRPYAFYYWIAYLFNGNVEKLFYGRVLN